MKLKYYYFVLLSFALTLVACDDDPVLLKDPVSALSNDCIKRSLPVAPNIVGNEIEFAYAMAIPNELGKTVVRSGCEQHCWCYRYLL